MPSSNFLTAFSFIPYVAAIFRGCDMDDFFSDYCKLNRALISHFIASQYFVEGAASYHDDFVQPLLTAMKTFQEAESARFFQRSPSENVNSYLKLYEFNNDLLQRYATGSLSVYDQYFRRTLENYLQAWHAALFEKGSTKLEDFFIHQEEDLRRVIKDYPREISAIEPEYGFHFERQPDSLMAETERFVLRKVEPSEKNIKIDPSLKPVIIIPPFVLGANILSFLPGERKSYAHSFANASIPTYIRIMKNIQKTPSVQTMTLEEDLQDTIYFCQKVKEAHGHPVTLNGYCQGGFTSLCNLLTGELDGLVDALITCVAPMDGTRSQGLGNFLSNLPEQFNDLAYGTKLLANGNKIADGNLMGWVYKLKSIEDSAPMATYLRDIMMLGGNRNGKPFKVNKTVAALNYWLQNERSDLPLSVTEMSFKSYNNPVQKDGTLPITIGGKKLNFNALKGKEFKWLLCYGETDDLVEKEVALAPLEWLDIEVTPFPKGHVAIATSWSHPESSCALHSRFGKENRRGPVRFQLDLAMER